MKFIKLTNYEFNTAMYVNAETICAVYVDYIGGTVVKSNGGYSCWVSEEPEEVLEMIDHALYGNNKS